MYGPIAILGYLTYHDSIRDSILPSIQTMWIQQACNALITVHCILTLTIILNPLNQDLEDLFHIPHRFGWQRILLRTATMLAVVFVGESVPNFGPILDLIGGSTMTLASVILPSLFYVHLLARQKKVEESGKSDAPPSLKDVLIYTPRRTLVICICIIVIGLIGGAAATFSAVVELSTTSFSLPCYVILFLHENHPEDNGASVYCCGPYQNVTHDGNAGTWCVPMPEIPFYS
ncbi:Amino acid transporter domain containing protein [Trichostrongylus colubriformis]|uniref:Amino acid transporter domain containing protein n=1 Tax=Trichostrongylus colubriformis TaxID=6319 RepID=A0AAN8F009_TRICO